MANHKPPIPTPKIRLLRYLPLLILLGLAVHLLIPQITTLEDSWQVVRKMSWWAVILAVVAQVFSYLGSGFTLHAIMKSNRQDLSIPRGALITMASYSLGLVAGGWVGAAAATYGWIHRENQDENTSVLAGTLPAILNNAVLAVVAVVGVVYLIKVHELSQAQLIGFGIVLFVLSLMVIGIITGLRSPGLIEKLAVRLFGRWAAFHHKVYEPGETITAVRQFARAWDSLSGTGWLKPALGAIANIGFDILTLYFLFAATGHDVNLGILFAGYGLPFILGKLAFMFPGGVGVMEGSMVTMYESLKVPSEVSVVVILGYRLFSFWLPSLLGFLAAAYLLRSKQNPNQNKP